MPCPPWEEGAPSGRMVVKPAAAAEIENLVNRAVRGAIASLKEELGSPAHVASGRNEVQHDDVRPRTRREMKTAARSSRSRTIEEQRQPREMSSSSSGEEFCQEGRQAKRCQGGGRGRNRLPPFTGQDSWEVWLNRFLDIADTRAWSKEQQLDEILPLIQGAAGDFVWGQLSKHTRRDFNLLVQELTYRFRKVETRKTFGARFSHRVQQEGESVQLFAAELKKLYFKAHPDRDRKTSNEDLLRRFLDGLIDEEASFHVEFFKEPIEIDDAVSEVINYLETKKRPGDESIFKKARRGVRAARDTMCDESEDERAARLPGRPAKPKEATEAPVPTASAPEPKLDEAATELKRMREELKQQYQTLQTKVDALERQTRGQRGPNQPTPPPNQPPRGPPPNRHSRPQNPPQYNCWACGQLGHLARQCGNAPFMMGQFQVAAPNDRSNATDQGEPRTMGN